jgi:hypothetical protein
MPAKNKPAARDSQRDFLAHLDVNKRAHDWAARCLELRAAGKTERAKAAEAKATSAKCWRLKRERRVTTRTVDSELTTKVLCISRCRSLAHPRDHREILMDR